MEYDSIEHKCCEYIIEHKYWEFSELIQENIKQIKVNKICRDGFALIHCAVLLGNGAAFNCLHSNFKDLDVNLTNIPPDDSDSLFNRIRRLATGKKYKAIMGNFIEERSKKK